MYEWIKVVHVFTIISWMAGMLYLPRLFVYHAEAEAGSDKSETFKVMERKLLRGIMNPSMIVAWITGLYMAFDAGWFTGGGWLHAKLVLVVLMTAAHMYYARVRKQFEADANTKTHGFYRIVNEVPAVFLVGILILVVVKPF
jgi:putative membrane protein